MIWNVEETNFWMSKNKNQRFGLQEEGQVWENLIELRKMWRNVGMNETVEFNNHCGKITRALK